MLFVDAAGLSPIPARRLRFLITAPKPCQVLLLVRQLVGCAPAALLTRRFVTPGYDVAKVGATPR